MTLNAHGFSRDNNPSSFDTQEEPADFVIITALVQERDAVLDQLPGYRKLPPVEDDIRVYYRAEIQAKFSDGTDGKYSIVVLCLQGMGRVQAAASTSDAIRRWHPRYILLIGIAGGIAAQHVEIGDILVSKQIVDYELQKITSQGPEVRWEVHRADARLYEACINFDSDDWFEAFIEKRPDGRKPRRHFGPIASGDKVIAFGQVLERYREAWPKLIGVEMEAAGVATAAFQSAQQPGFFMIRGVSDLADEKKNTTGVEQMRQYVCDATAAYAVAFLKSGPIPFMQHVEQRKTKRVQLIIEGKLDEFTVERRQDLKRVLGALLQVEAGNIVILQVLAGSIVVLLEMPENAADRLYELAEKDDLRLISLEIRSVLLQGKAEIRIGERKKKMKDENWPNSPINLSGSHHKVGTIVGGNIILNGGNYIDGDQTNIHFSDQRSAILHLVQGMQDVQARLQDLKQESVLDAADLQSLEVVEVRLRQATEEAQKPQPAFENIHKALEKASAMAQALDSSQAAAVAERLSELAALVKKYMG